MICYQYQVRDSYQTAGDKPEEGGDDVKSSCPLWPGPHTYYNGGYRGQRQGDLERIPKSPSQFGLSLQPDSMKLESLVIANQHVAVNTFSGLVHTARQTMGVSNTRSRWHNLRSEPSKVGPMTGVKS